MTDAQANCLIYFLHLKEKLICLHLFTELFRKSIYTSCCYQTNEFFVLKMKGETTTSRLLLQEYIYHVQMFVI